MGNHATAKKIIALAHPSLEIGRLSDEFYAKVRPDLELGPIERAMPGDWGPHLATMHDFWSSIMLSSGRYRAKADRIAENLKLALFSRRDRPWQRSAP
jgi:hemoglobin